MYEESIADVKFEESDGNSNLTFVYRGQLKVKLILSVLNQMQQLNYPG